MPDLTSSMPLVASRAYWPEAADHLISNAPTLGMSPSRSRSRSRRRTLTCPKEIFKRRLIERQWLIVRIEECKRNHGEM